MKILSLRLVRDTDTSNPFYSVRKVTMECKMRTLPIRAYLEELQERNGWVYKYMFLPGEILSIVRSVEGNGEMKEVFRGEVSILENGKRYVDFPQRGVRIVMDAPSSTHCQEVPPSGESDRRGEDPFKGKAVNIDTYLASKRTREVVYSYGISPTVSRSCKYLLVIYAKEKDIRKEVGKYPLHHHKGDDYYADITNRAGNITRLLVYFFM